jgi:LDH2 family malate/lactate/ureidoglycolate dehydrogenase
MSEYPGTERERRVPAGALAGLVTAVFLRCGLAGEDAALVADTLVTADLRGIHSHGVLRVPEYVRKLRAEGVDPRGRPAVVRDAGAALVVDGGNAMGQVAAAFAMRAAVARARTTGVAAAAVRGSNHCGALEYYARLAVAERMVGIVTTNALPTMAPWGGRDRILGINPLAVAVPAAAEAPLVFDAAFSGSSHGRIRVFRQKGEPIPEGWAFDAEGRPTTDPARALEGLLQPVGGYKGTGLALMMGILSSVLSGAAYGTELGSLEAGPRPGRDGHLCLALRVAAFEDVGRFTARVDAIARQVRDSRRAPGVERIWPPGHLEADTEARYRRGGIPLADATLADLAAAARGLGLDPAPLGRAPRGAGGAAPGDRPAGPRGGRPLRERRARAPRGRTTPRA